MFRIQDGYPRPGALPPLCPVSPLSSASHRARSTCTGIAIVERAPQHRTPNARHRPEITTCRRWFRSRREPAVPPSYVICTSTCRCPPIHAHVLSLSTDCTLPRSEPDPNGATASRHEGQTSKYQNAIENRVKTPTHCGSRDSWLLLNVFSLMFDPG